MKQRVRGIGDNLHHPRNGREGGMPVPIYVIGRVKFEVVSQTMKYLR